MIESGPLVSTLTLAVLATWPPAAAFAVIIIFLRPHPRRAATVSMAAVSVALVSAVWLLARLWQAEAPIRYGMRWVASGDLTIPFGFLIDPVSLLMLVVVAVICCLVQVYSLGYMAGDPGFARYYAFMSLFAWAMTSLTISLTLIQLYIYWELVGLASYFLIGFWYEKFSASEAGKKAFIMTRLGDVAFFLGLLLVLIHFGNLDIMALSGPGPAERMSPFLLTVSSLLIFGGIVGKSAQFPLLTWLPDAMEGPTTVSALLHSATMVAAGVYLFARLFPLFSHSTTAMAVFLAIGTISMIAAATMAMVSRDIKRVWAYSTISQLGYMIMGLAAGGFFAGIFHLTTHAGFKALLFLCSGVFIHHLGTNDMVEIGRRGGRRLKLPMACMVIGAAALAGIPPLSGFFSKELILGVLAGLSNPIWVAAALLGVFLTAYYSFRLIFIILFPDAPTAAGGPNGHEAGDHRTADRLMGWPLIILSAGTLLLGFWAAPVEHFLTRGPLAIEAAAHHSWVLFASLGLAAAAVALAWFEFGRRGAARVGFVERVAWLNDFFAERWYLDHFYRFALDRFVYRGIAALCARNDQKVIDGGIDGLSRGTVAAGRRLAFLHTGMIQYRLLIIFAVMVLLGVYFIF
ncbi:MAG: NADH-quinone oxidoreductase subunit L [Desulfobacterales bacterium]